MQTITNETLGLVEQETNKFSVEASDIGLRPGEWPPTLNTTLGNGKVFIAQRREIKDGDLLWVDYLQGISGGLPPVWAKHFQGSDFVWLRVYND